MRFQRLAFAAAPWLAGWSAAAIVHHDPADLQVHVGGLDIDVNGDGATDVALFTNVNFLPQFATSFIAGRGNGWVVTDPNFGSPAAAALFANVQINSARPHFAIANLASYDQSGFYGTWAPQFGPTVAYAGFRFDLPDGDHYGWIRLLVGPTLLDADFQALEWAYETSPGATILTGAIPAPGGACLGVAALALSLRRRGRR